MSLMVGMRRLAAIAAVVLAFAAAASPSRAEMFGKQETPYTDLRPFPKWTGVLDRYFRELGQREGNCASPDFNRCHYKEWQAFIEKMRAEPRDRQLEHVNTFFNRRRYIVDPINWGVADYWETPGQFFAKNGDCEDYAIAKYMTLRDLGWAVADMRVVVVQDMNLNLVHAVLAVADGGRTQILDNQLAVLVEPRRIKHYRPIYAVNEEGWWRFH
ncbi:Transglutaminase family protein cysteine peptidase BTLCP [uncultured Alphaproteobacteria bacterium]|uniref:Transglutaminase family protein cysteine peptidase BTLCP n=1 Tax=uncultured Alphaproteobacteria bacterium TaxID=91750 RepID=A0A212J6K2_9PROT|nr:Transglutaminase family protein cysteine peptidase BTLCP [uncultured Alphaproteobacteria bacterium]